MIFSCYYSITLKNYNKNLQIISMIDKNIVKKFIQNVLGCGCPEEVFEYIDIQQDIVLEEKSLRGCRINTGNRLLVYTWLESDPRIIKENALPLLIYGKNERDTGGFNRFRLVIINDRREQIERLITAEFNAFKGEDDKIHLHIISEREYSLYF